nr:hypothetical protein [uncultured Roseateles sp.]
MRPAQHPTTNAVDQCPDTKGETYRAAVPVTVMPDGTRIVFFYPHPDELQRINAGKAIMLAVDPAGGYCVTVER